MGETASRERPRTRRRRLLTLLLLLPISIAGYCSVPALRPSWFRPVEPFRIAGPLYYVGTAGLASYLLDTPRGLVLIDVPMRANANLVLRNIRRLSFDPAEIRYQLASHAHFDHVGGIAAVSEVSKAELLLSEADALLAASGGKADFFPAKLFPYSPLRADRVLENGERLELGGDIVLTALVTPGHTRGCTSWSIAFSTETGAMQNALLICSLTLLPFHRLEALRESYPGIAKDYCESLRTLRAQRPAVFLATHTNDFDFRQKYKRLRESGDDEAFVDPEGYTKFVDLASRRINAKLLRSGVHGGCAELLESPSSLSPEEGSK